MAYKSGSKAWYKNYENSKEYKDNIKELNRKLYFSTLFRNNMRKVLLKSQKDALAALDLVNKLNLNDIQARKTYALWDSILELSGEFLKSCDRAEEYIKSGKLLNCRFKAYRKFKGKQVIFKCFFYKVADKKNKINYLFLPHGLSKKRFKGQLVRKRLSLSNFTCFDSGKFGQILKNFDYTHFTFRGRKTYKLKVTQRGKVKDNLWIQLMT